MMFKRIKKMTILLVAAALMACGCAASLRKLEPSPYSDADFDNNGGITLATERRTYPAGVKELSYTVTNGGDGEAYYGIFYSVEQRREDGWFLVPFREDVAWVAIAYRLDAGESQTYQAELSQLKYSLSAGEYRLVKEINGLAYAAEFIVVK